MKEEEEVAGWWQGGETNRERRQREVNIQKSRCFFASCHSSFEGSEPRLPFRELLI